MYDYYFCSIANQGKVPVLRMDLTKCTSRLFFDCLSLNFLHMFAKQAGIAMDTFHCPSTSLHVLALLAKLPHMIPIEHISMSFVRGLDGKSREKAAEKYEERGNIK